ncbi:MAG: long-chain fatty acid--CoA ligase, partial [Sphaerochaetaceae bacterium]
EIEDRFQLYDDIETICIMGYMVDKATRSEGIRALIYPSEKYVMDTKKDNPGNYRAVIQKHMEGIVEQVNKSLQTYKKITRVTVVDEAIPLTSTKKVKRFLVDQQYKD